MPERSVVDPRPEYERRLASRVQTVAGREHRHIVIGNSKLATVIVFLLLVWLRFAERALSAYWLLLPVVAYAALAILHERTIRARRRAEAAAAFYRAGIARMEDRWSGTGASGERFRDPQHVYADDLDLFGTGCLFELLSIARLPMGENRLAEWLKNPSPIRSVIERQGLVAELREKLDLREDVAVAAEHLRVRLDQASLVAWCEADASLGGRAWRAMAALGALAAVGTLVAWLATGIPWPIVGVLIAETAAYIRLRKRANTVMSGLSCNAEGLELFSEILARFEREVFASRRLQELSAEFSSGAETASRAVRRLARIVYWIDGRESLLARLLDLPLLYGIQTALAAEAWRRRHGRRMRAWIEAVAEMEALLSLAAYSFEHPGDPFPKFCGAETSGAVFDGEELSHPLIPAAQCVRNSVRLDASSRVLLVSGSNMSGKSTLLRTVGINAVLAMAGAPIRGKCARLTPLALGTRLRSIDSLQEGRSTFYTELLRIRQVFDLLDGERPILFLLDELLDGTNSHDRKIGAENLVRAFLERRAIGIVTTHDLALTEMSKSLGSVVHNSHFEDQVEGGKMRFDYKLREGVVTKSNALELMRLVGLKA